MQNFLAGARSLLKHFDKSKKAYKEVSLGLQPFTIYFEDKCKEACRKVPLGSTILYKVFWEGLRNRPRLDWAEGVWYLFLATSGHQCQKFISTEGDWALCSDPMQFWISLIFPFPKFLSNTRGISYIMTSSSTLLTVNGMCTNTLQNFKLLCKRLSEKFCFATYIFENESTF